MSYIEEDEEEDELQLILEGRDHEFVADDDDNDGGDVDNDYREEDNNSRKESNRRHKSSQQHLHYDEDNYTKIRSSAKKPSVSGSNKRRETSNTSSAGKSGHKRQKLSQKYDDYSEEDDDGYRGIDEAIEVKERQPKKVIARLSDDNDGGGDDNNTDTAKVKAKVRRIVTQRKLILNESKLMSKDGIASLPKLFADFKFDGKGHELKDLNAMMFQLNHWAHRLFPSLTFDDFIDRCEQLGHKKALKNYIYRIRTDMSVDSMDIVVNKDDDDDNNLSDADNNAFAKDFDAIIGNTVATNPVKYANTTSLMTTSIEKVVDSNMDDNMSDISDFYDIPRQFKTNDNIMPTDEFSVEKKSIDDKLSEINDDNNSDDNLQEVKNEKVTQNNDTNKDNGLIVNEKSEIVTQNDDNNEDNDLVMNEKIEIETQNDGNNEENDIVMNKNIEIETQNDDNIEDNDLVMNKKIEIETQNDGKNEENDIVMNKNIEIETQNDGNNDIVVMNDKQKISDNDNNSDNEDISEEELLKEINSDSDD
ncbi:protein PFC0760c-like [Oppia nitens]|uniref:protein PFC0760c-like n=1 Tax=Oppia nitens TaxID=1686743 RepID=UPI0023DCBA57|nr:protein PFC0760c-like [Oppia nitens]